MQLPAHARLVGPLHNLAFLDVQGVNLPCSLTPLEAWNGIMARPLPGLGLAFRLRDAISARFGVRRIGGFSGKRADRVAAGDKLDFFLLEETTADRLVLTERDRHLDVMTCVTVEGLRLSVVSSVVTHNRFGRAYMIPVAAAHPMIVRMMLRRLVKSLGGPGPRAI